MIEELKRCNGDVATSYPLQDNETLQQVKAYAIRIHNSPDIPTVARAGVDTFQYSMYGYNEDNESVHESNKNITDELSRLLGISVTRLALFKTIAKSSGIIHRDVSSICALNIPIANYTNSWMEWFYEDDINKAAEPPTFPRVKRQLARPVIPNDRVPTPAYRKRILQPTLTRIFPFHRINNEENDNDRIVASIRFREPLTYDDLARHFEGLGWKTE